MVACMPPSPDAGVALTSRSSGSKTKKHGMAAGVPRVYSCLLFRDPFITLPIHVGRFAFFRVRVKRSLAGGPPYRHPASRLGEMGGVIPYWPHCMLHFDGWRIARRHLVRAHLREEDWSFRAALRSATDFVFHPTAREVHYQPNRACWHVGTVGVAPFGSLQIRTVNKLDQAGLVCMICFRASMAT